RLACGFGGLALHGVLATEAARAAAANPLAVKAPHFPGRAKRVIFLFLHGGVSHVDTFDPQPKLAEMDGKPLPFAKPAFEFAPTGNLLKSPWKFAAHRQSGTEVSELFPHLAQCVDDMCVVRSMNGGNQVSHGPALLAMNTGDGVFNRPSLGAWTLYGLGSENQNLPGFITLSPSIYHGGAPNHGTWGIPGRILAHPPPSADAPSRARRDAFPKGRVPPGPGGRRAKVAAPASRLVGPPDPRSPGPHRCRGPPGGAHRQLRDGLPHADARAEGIRPLWREQGDA